MLLALDPGLNSPGIAVFDGTALVHAQRVSIPASFVELADGERWLRVAEHIVSATHAVLITEVIFERPQWYSKAKSKGDPNQLAGVAGVAATVVGILSCLNQGIRAVHSPHPADWVGQLPKTCPKCKANKKSCKTCLGSAWLTPRGRRIRSRLTPAEIALCPDQNDAIDSVGIGLWQLGRFTPRSVLSNGRDGR